MALHRLYTNNQPCNVEDATKVERHLIVGLLFTHESWHLLANKVYVSTMNYVNIHLK